MTEATLLNRLKRYGYGQQHGPMAKACAEAAVEIERLNVEIAVKQELIDALVRGANRTAKMVMERTVLMATEF